jgi:hypothetical protein
LFFGGAQNLKERNMQGREEIPEIIERLVKKQRTVYASFMNIPILKILFFFFFFLKEID